MIVHQSRHAHLEWIEDGAVLLKRFEGAVVGAELREAFNAGQAAMARLGGHKWLSDNRHLHPYRRDDVRWIKEDWLPRMLKIEWQFWALVEPHGVMSTLSMAHFINPFRDAGIEVEFFDTPEDALAWIQPLQCRW